MKPFCKLLIILTCLSFLLLSASCKSQGISADSIAHKLLNLYPSIPPCSQYIKNADSNSQGYLSPEDFSYLYTGVKKRLPEWDKIDEFRIIMSSTVNMFEIHIIKAKSSSDADEIAKLLGRRLRLLKAQMSDSEDFPYHNPDIFTDGRFIVLLATENNESAIRVLKKLL